MMQGKGTCVVIAARNEAWNIREVVRRTRKWGDVLVVDNASRDGTSDAAVAEGATVLIHEVDTHIKQSYVDGFRAAIVGGYDRVLQFDAGLSFDPAEIGRFMIHPWADLVVGYREMDRRKWISRAGGLLTRVVTGMPFQDATCGFRLWRTDGLARLDLDGLRCRAHGFQIELLWQAWRAGMSIVPVPVSYKPGKTSANRAVALEAFRAVLRMNRWTSMPSREKGGVVVIRRSS